MSRLPVAAPDYPYRVLQVYPGLAKPKHHFGQHASVNVLNFGPPRFYWCAMPCHTRCMRRPALHRPSRLPRLVTCRAVLPRCAALL